MENSEIRAYLDNFIKARIEGVLRPLIQLESEVEPDSKYSGAAFFALSFDFMALFFCYVEFLGYLCNDGEKGKNLSNNAVDFLRRYFGKVNPNYKEVGGLLYHIHRHGNVHELKPKRIQLTDGTTVTWEIGSGSVRESDPWHLTGWNMGSAYIMKVSENSLCNDLASAVDIYYEDLCKDPVLRQNFEDAFKKLREPEDEVDVEKRQHIRRCDFDFIKNLPDFVAEG